MVRPALSAARGLDVIDLLCASPARSFTLSEIARGTGVNVSSCHSVLNVLVERGYLLRDPQLKTYTLGPLLFAAGQAALASQPLSRSCAYRS
jgi:DNA-binding IclR family transcriptional regulator